MAFPVSTPTLTQLQSIDAIADAKAGILQSLSYLFYTPTCADYTNVCFLPLPESLVFNINELVLLADQTEFMKNTLCALACEELSAAKLIESLSCKLAIDKGLIGIDDQCCKCCCCDI